jgi:hypothetical protein
LEPSLSTRDHVPPKGLFGEPRPSNLITVPACGECNGGANLDDEFMQRFAMAQGTEMNQDANAVGQNILRAMNMPEKRGMRMGLLKTLTPAKVFSPMGLWMGFGFKMTYDGDRLKRILTKITKGMLWEITKRKLKAERIRGFSESQVPRLPADYAVFVHQVGAAPSKEFEQNETEMLAGNPASIGERTFRYLYLLSNQDPFTSIWRFSFYDRFHFMGYTGRDDGTNTTFLTIQDASG